MKSSTLTHQSPSRVLALEQENLRLKERIAWFEKQFFGSKKERLPSPPSAESINLFESLNAEMAALQNSATPSLPVTHVPAHTRTQKGHGRSPWPKHLERVETIVDPSAHDLVCTCCGADKIVMGFDVTEVLEKRPDPYFVNRIIRKKYACSKHPELGVAQAPVPARFIPKGNTGNTVIVEVIACKYIYHLPLVRQEKIFKRLDIPISPSTMVGWIEEFASRAMPIVDELQKRIRRGGVAYSDDTSIPVMMDSKPGVAHRGAMWLYSNGSDAVVFDYSQGREKAVPMNWLNGFRGYLHTDGYAAYISVHHLGGVEPVYCYAHARRKFLAALESGDELARRSLTLIGRLFLVDRFAREKKLSLAEFKAARERVSRRLLEKLTTHWIKIGPQVLPQSLLGKALAYVQKRIGGFKTFLKSPRLRLDNNLSERELRRVVVGRKSYMFCGSEEGARRAAVIYSLVGTCELIGLNPNQYFLEVMQRLSMNRECSASSLMPHVILREMKTTLVV